MSVSVEGARGTLWCCDPTPSVTEPESFHRLIGGLPLRWPSARTPGRFPECRSAPRGLWCLRDSGVVAPSAVPCPSKGQSLKDQETLSRAVPCRLPDIDAPSSDAPHNLSQSGVSRAAKINRIKAKLTLQPSFPRRRESRLAAVNAYRQRPRIWIPAFAAMTVNRTYHRLAAYQRVALYLSWSSVSWKPTSASKLARNTAWRTSGVLSGSTAAS